MQDLPGAGLAFVFVDIISVGLLIYMGPRILFGGASLPSELQSTQLPWEPGPFYD